MARTLLIPSLFDDWFPLLRHVFASDRWEPVLLTEDTGLADLGLRYIHSDMCYPAHLVAGQIFAALQSGKYDVHNCGVLIGQAGDECRGSCFIRFLRRSLVKAGYPDVPLLSLNVRDIDRENGMPIRAAMVFQALAAAVWGDVLAVCRDQIRPYEAESGAAFRLWEQWMEDLAEDMRRPLSRRRILDRCVDIIASFRRLPTVEREVQKIAIVGEIYTRNCRLGNWDLKEFLSKNGCQVSIAGLTWYALYYMDSHTLKGPWYQRVFYRLVRRYTAAVQRDMIGLLRAGSFDTLPPFAAVKENAKDLAPMGVTVADGWMISGEIQAWARVGYRKILCVQPFACLPGHIFGKGQYAKLQRHLPHTRIVSVDYDASTGEGTVESRVRMLLDEEING